MQHTAFEVSKFLDNNNVDETWTHALPFSFSVHTFSVL
jgi:hypothetical protein